MTFPFTDLVDLASEQLGGAALMANDEFFAGKENLLKPAAPVWNEEYTDRGKWMDGWETRRRREPGYDWCIIRLGLPGIVHGVLVDTSFFRGNYPEQCSIEAASVAGVPTVAELTSATTTWTELLPRSVLAGDAPNAFAITARKPVTHVRLNIFPDGGVARLRVFGEVVPDWKRLAGASEIDLAALENGGHVMVCSDMFYGHRHNLIMPGRAASMRDGWETRRRRGPGHEWAVIRLATPGTIGRAEVDTSHYKGNAPGSCSLEGIAAPDATSATLAGDALAWSDLLPRTRLEPHTRHYFHEELRAIGDISHVRLDIFPDGGVSRLRLWGTPAFMRA